MVAGATGFLGELAAPLVEWLIEHEDVSVIILNHSLVVPSALGKKFSWSHVPYPTAQVSDIFTRN